MIEPETLIKIRHLYFAEHWKIGTIAAQLDLHHYTIRAAVDTGQFSRTPQERAARQTGPYVEFIEQTLKQYPRLRATRIFHMIQPRGYTGSVSQVRGISVSSGDVRTASGFRMKNLKEKAPGLRPGAFSQSSRVQLTG